MLFLLSNLLKCDDKLIPHSFAFKLNKEPCWIYPMNEIHDELDLSQAKYHQCVGLKIFRTRGQRGYNKFGYGSISNHFTT